MLLGSVWYRLGALALGSGPGGTFVKPTSPTSQLGLGGTWLALEAGTSLLNYLRMPLGAAGIFQMSSALPRASLCVQGTFPGYAGD